MKPSDLTPEIIHAAIRIHRKLGPGLLESAYEACLAHELQLDGLRIERQKAVPLYYDTVKLDCGFRADLVVEGRVVVELNAKTFYTPSTRLNCSLISGSCTSRSDFSLTFTWCFSKTESGAWSTTTEKTSPFLKSF